MSTFWRYFRNVLFISFLLVIIIVGFLFVRGYSISLHQLRQSKLDNFTREYTAIIDGYRTLALSLYDNVVDIPRTTEKLSMAIEDESQRGKLRAALYDQLLASYGKFSRYNIRQFHFHLIDNTSFLRFHTPERFGDDLTDIRSTVRNTNATGLPSSGFEEGRIFNGYRFVFPIFHNLSQVGSVEISFSMKAMVKTLDELYARPSSFILSREVMEEKLFDLNSLAYRLWPVSDQFVLDTGIPDKGFPDRFMTETEKVKLKSVLEAFPSVPALFSSKSLGDLIIFPIENFEGRVVAYMICHVDSETNKLLRQNLIWTIILLFLMFVVLSILFYFISRNQKILNKMASFDGLTETLSRNALFNRLQLELDRFKRYNTPVSLILFDLDEFKDINDNYGHMKGDEVLKQFAKEIIDSSRTTDYLGRLGGDEFLSVLPGTNQKGAEVTAEHLQESLRKIYYPGIGTVTVSIGVGEISLSDEIVEKFIDRVDKGLYISKKEGRNRITRISNIE
ncbi:MAG: diguanylate cyclase [Spirochaetales bacterium]|nr:diguanylate cyclase [Spirochaetales bacterium]